MKNVRVEINDDGTAFYITIDPEGKWASTTQPDDLITVDWDPEGRVIGVEAIGSAARQAIQAFFRSMADYPARDRQSVDQALEVMGWSSDGA